MCIRDSLLRDRRGAECLEHGLRHDERERHDRKDLADEQQDILHTRDGIALFLKAEAQFPDIGAGDRFFLKVGFNEVDEQERKQPQKPQKSQRHQPVHSMIPTFKSSSNSIFSMGVSQRTEMKSAPRMRQYLSLIHI